MTLCTGPTGGLASPHTREGRVIFIDPLKGDAMRKFMRKFALLSTSLFVALVALLAAVPAQADDNNISFVKSTGSGSACTFTDPCTGFQAAHDATLENGEIHCLDSQFIGAVTITKSITIDCAGVAGTSFYIIVNGPGIVVTLRNLTLASLILHYPTGIEFKNGAALFVENCVIENYVGAAFVGIKFRPSAPGSKLVMTDTVVRNSGSGSTGGGIVVSPQAGGSAQVVLNRVSVHKNVFGIVADGTGSTGGINMTITDSVSSGNLNDGLVATTPAGGAPIGVYVKNTRLANNGFGIRSIGTNVTVRADGSSVIGNGTGLTALNSGALLTFGNNAVQANGANGAFSGPVVLQ